MRFAEAVEEGKEQNGEAGAHQRGYEEMQVEYRRGTPEQRPLRDRQNCLMKMKQDEHKAEAADGMFRVNLCAHR